jgi:transcriptional regulator with XRE-family HTH domain
MRLRWVGGHDAERVMDQGRQAVPALAGPGRQLGAIMRGARTAQGLTLAELGHRTGYSVAQVSRYERGLALLTDIAVLHRFAHALAIAPQLLGLSAEAVRPAHVMASPPGPLPSPMRRHEPRPCRDRFIRPSRRSQYLRRVLNRYRDWYSIGK